MQKWWNNVRLTEAFLKGLYQPKVGLNHPDAPPDIQQYQTMHDAIKWYGRRKLKRELSRLRQKMSG